MSSIVLMWSLWSPLGMWFSIKDNWVTFSISSLSRQVDHSSFCQDTHVINRFCQTFSSNALILFTNPTPSILEHAPTSFWSESTITFYFYFSYLDICFLFFISRYLCTSSCCRFKYRCNSYQEIRWVTDSVLTSQSQRPVSMRSNKYMKMIPSVREPKWKILIWLTQWMVLLQQNSTRRPLTSKHFYGGSFCSKNKQITTVLKFKLNVVYKSAPKWFLGIQVISRSWVQWTVVSFTWQPLSRKLRTIMIMALVCTWWRQLMETRAICLLCVQLLLKSQEMLLSRILLQ